MEHEGHRQRMLQKLEEGGVTLDHELLEILLFNAYPRKNTNPVAHALLGACGSLRGVFDADLDELKKIEGVGENVAAYIKCVAACAKPAYSAETEEKHLKNYGDFKDFTAARLRTKKDEVLELYFIERNGKVKYVFSRTDLEQHYVSLGRNEIPAVIASIQPYGMVIAHNHLMGGSRPSERDDRFTCEMASLCKLYGVKLFDHCIYASDNDIYSYFSADRFIALNIST